MTEESLSPRGKEIFLFIKDYCRKNGYPPTVREIGDKVGLSSSCTVYYHLRKLEEKGVIRRHRFKPRAIEVITAGEEPKVANDLISVPLINGVFWEDGQVKWGEVETYFFLPRFILEEGVYFFLKAPTSGTGSHSIRVGDLMMINQSQTLSQGDLALVWVETGIHIWEVNPGRFSASYSSFSGKEEQLTKVIGKIVGFWRTL